MPRKYLRITRRCTCVAPDLMEEEKMIQQRFSLNRCIFLQEEAAVQRLRLFVIPYSYPEPLCFFRNRPVYS